MKIKRSLIPLIIILVIFVVIGLIFTPNIQGQLYPGHTNYLYGLNGNFRYSLGYGYSPYAGWGYGLSSPYVQFGGPGYGLVNCNGLFGGFIYSLGYPCGTFGGLSYRLGYPLTQFGGWGYGMAYPYGLFEDIYPGLWGVNKIVSRIAAQVALNEALLADPVFSFLISINPDLLPLLLADPALVAAYAADPYLLDNPVAYPPILILLSNPLIGPILAQDLQVLALLAVDPNLLALLNPVFLEELTTIAPVLLNPILLSSPNVLADPYILYDFYNTSFTGFVSGPIDAFLDANPNLALTDPVLYEFLINAL